MGSHVNLQCRTRGKVLFAYATNMFVSGRRRGTCNQVNAVLALNSFSMVIISNLDVNIG